MTDGKFGKIFNLETNLKKHNKNKKNYKRNQNESTPERKPKNYVHPIDRYDHILAWIWVTHNNSRELLQAKIAANDYVEKFYDYGDYKYENKVRKSLNDKYHIFQGRG